MPQNRFHRFRGRGVRPFGQVPTFLAGRPRRVGVLHSVAQFGGIFRKIPTSHTHIEKFWKIGFNCATLCNNLPPFGQDGGWARCALWGRAPIKASGRTEGGQRCLPLRAGCPLRAGRRSMSVIHILWKKQVAGRDILQDGRYKGFLQKKLLGVMTVTDTKGNLGTLQPSGRTACQKADWLIDGLCRQGDIVLVTAQPKVGKSAFVLNLALAVAMGKPFLGHQTKQTAVLLIDYDKHGETLRRLKHLGALSCPTLFVTNDPVYADDLDELEAEIQFGKFGLVVIDPLLDFVRPTLRGLSSLVAYFRGVGQQIQRLRDVAVRTGCTFVLVHFDRKGAHEALGGTFVTSKVDVVIRLTRHPKDDRTLVVTWGQNNTEKVEVAALFDGRCLRLPAGAPTHRAGSPQNVGNT